MPTTSYPEPPRWLWLVLPPVLYGMHYVAALVLDYRTYDNWFVSELGITEELTVIALLAAIVIAVTLARGFLRLADRRMALWFALLALGCLYFAGEEASWGQHWIGWATPDDWALTNEQAETNLHNTGNWLGGLLDQLPRNLLTLAALIGGGIMPLWRRARGRELDPDERASWLLPTMVAVPAGLLAGLGSVPEKLQEQIWGTAPIDVQAGEIKELMLASFLFLYALSARYRLRARLAAPEPAAQKTAG